MSGGGRRGEIRIRKARPVAKQPGGTHNRAARRALKAQQQDMFLKPSEAELLRAMWEAFGKHQANRKPVPFDPVAYDVEHFGGPWPGHIPMGPCITSALRAAPRYAKLSPRDFSRAGERLANIVAFEGSEHIACDTGDLNKREQAEKRKQVAALGRSLGLGSCVPGGIKFCGLWLETVDGETAIRMLVEKGSVPEEASCAT